MCDYSLHGIPSRLAVHGDELVVHRFETATIGLASANDLVPLPRSATASLWDRVKQFFETPLQVAACCVCVPPGAELILLDIPKHLQREWHVGQEERVWFTQVTAAAHQHRDALRLPTGREVLLQRLRVGMRLRVVSVGEDAPDMVPIAAHSADRSDLPIGHFYL